ncbi:MAG: RdgB/HAM1 family non-canonical purine NTP pyrophosphatase [Alphaproteobacteria bacterium]
MTRKLLEKSLLLATHNQGKVREFQPLFAPYGISLCDSASLKLPEPEETGDSFIDNAVLKAAEAANSSNMVALADDSGLCVEALGGLPGIYSARWAGVPRDFDAAMAKIAALLEGKENWRACFVAALALVWPDGHTHTVEARVEGTLIWPMRGAKGFGYDPMFQPDGYQQSFAEMPSNLKEQLSHRTKAFELLAAQCLIKI